MEFHAAQLRVEFSATQGPKVSTTPLQQWGFRQCLPFSWTTLRSKHCRHAIAVMGVVDTFEQAQSKVDFFFLIFASWLEVHLEDMF